MKERISRRYFLKISLASALSLLGCSSYNQKIGKDEDPLHQKQKEKLQSAKNIKDDKREESASEEEHTMEEPVEGKMPDNLPRRKLGKTEISTSLLGLGGAFALARRGGADNSAKIIHRAVELGVNYIDTAPTYQDSETNIGLAVENIREKVILASKTLDRTYDGTMRLFENSLKQLKTDYLDIYQLHGVHSQADLERALAPDGALKALKALQDEGVIRYTGITGHKNPEILKRALKEFDFDCLLLALNAGDIYYQSFQQELLRYAEERQVGMIAMKAASYGRIFKKDGITSMKQALGYVLTLPVSTAVVGISNLDELEENVDIVQNFTPYNKDKMKQIEELAAPYWQEINFFKKQW